MFNPTVWLTYYKRRSNRFLRSGECFLRVHNYPLSFRMKYKRLVGQPDLWNEKFVRKEASKQLHGVLKNKNEPFWYVSEKAR